MFCREILGYEPITASKLGIAECADRLADRRFGEPYSAFGPCARLPLFGATAVYLRTYPIVGVHRRSAVELSAGGKGPNPCVEPVVVFRRPQEIIVEARLRREGQVRCERVVRIHFDSIVLRLVNRIERGFDDTKIPRLRRARVRIEFEIGFYRDIDARKGRIVGESFTVRHSKGIARIKRSWKAALAQKMTRTIGSNTLNVRTRWISVYLRRNGVCLAQLLRRAHAVVVFGEVLPHRGDLKSLNRLEAQRYPA